MQVKDKARRDAEDVRDGYWLLGFPVDPERIASSMGIIVERLPLEEGISGMIRVEPGMDPVVYLNENEVIQRQRFTLAHEIGHYYERTDSGDTDFNFIDHRGAGYDLHEFYADEFAGALLMPEAEFRRLQASDIGLAGMARHFGVSIAAIQKRRQRLDLLSASAH